MVVLWLETEELIEGWKKKRNKLQKKFVGNYDKIVISENSEHTTEVSKSIPYNLGVSW